jgi:hypothetical protein
VHGAGTYISNRVSDKITPLADNVFLCRSGSAADTQAVSDIGARRRRGRATGLRAACCVRCADARKCRFGRACALLLCAVRHFVHQHTMEIGGLPDVRTVAMLAQSVRRAGLRRALRAPCHATLGAQALALRHTR